MSRLVGLSIDGKRPEFLTGVLADVVGELYDHRAEVAGIQTGRLVLHFTLSRGEPVVQLEWCRMGRKIRRENAETTSTAVNTVIDEAA